MQNLQIEQTVQSPKVILDANNGLIQIIGASYPENTFDFYQPIQDWIGEYFKNPQELTTVNINLEILSSSSQKVIFDIFKTLQNASYEHDVVVNWIYDEENDIALEDGEDYQADFSDLHINLVEKE